MTLDPDLFDRAADDVSRDGGWLQGDLGSLIDGRPVCAMGAVYRQCDAELRVASIARPYFDHLKATLGLSEFAPDGDFMDPIAKWNDAADRTAGEVADAFRTAAKVLRG